LIVEGETSFVGEVYGLWTINKLQPIVVDLAYELAPPPQILYHCPRYMQAGLHNRLLGLVTRIVNDETVRPDTTGTHQFTFYTQW
jgi:hypothetical protein